MEIWKQINNYSKYEISDNGKVRNKETQKEISQRSLDKDEYPTVKLYNDNGIRKKLYVRRLVAEAFIPNPENLKSVRLKNGDKFDNDVSNLFWK